MEKRGKRIRKARITTAAATTMTLKLLVVMITNRSLKSCFDFASHWLSRGGEGSDTQLKNKTTALVNG